MSNLLPHLTLESGKQPRHAIIWLHGLGADGHDFAPMAEELRLPVAMRYILPHAPRRPITVNGGFVMPGWYDIGHPKLTTQQDAAGIRASQAAIEALIAQEAARGIAASHIFLAGFSQGGAIALHTALRHSPPLAGVLALSTYLPLIETVATEACAHSLPIFMAHGRDDTVIPCETGAASKEALKNLGHTVTWQEYAMAHSVCTQELRDIETWLGNHLPD